MPEYQSLLRKVMAATSECNHSVIPGAKIKENRVTDIPVQLWPGGITGARAGGTLEHSVSQPLV